MKKCYNIKTWEEITDVMISLSEKYITISKIYNKGCSGEFFNNEYIDKSTPTDTILAKLCELTGAKMYGDYIILEETTYMDAKVLRGDIYAYYTMRNFTTYMILLLIDKKVPMDVFYNKIIPLKKEAYFKPLIKKPGEGNTNIFEEYSKFLRQEENKWEEVKKILNL
jgi:hypothetical protein